MSHKRDWINENPVVAEGYDLKHTSEFKALCRRNMVKQPEKMGRKNWNRQKPQQTTQTQVVHLNCRILNVGVPVPGSWDMAIRPSFQKTSQFVKGYGDQWWWLMVVFPSDSMVKYWFFGSSSWGNRWEGRLSLFFSHSFLKAVPCAANLQSRGAGCMCRFCGYMCTVCSIYIWVDIVYDFGHLIYT